MTRQENRAREAAHRQHHPGLILMTSFAITLLSLAILLATTVFNVNFTSRVLTKGPAPELMQAAINQAGQEHGLPGELVTKSEAQQLLKTTVRQVYAGEAVNLNLAPIQARLVGQAQAATGLPAALVGSVTTPVISNQLTGLVNDQINTSTVRQLTTGLQLGRRINQVVLVVAGGLVMLSVLMTLKQPGTLTFGVLSWALFWSLVVTTLLVGSLTTKVADLVPNPQLGPVMTDFVQAVSQRGWQLVGGLALLTLVGLGGRLMTRRMLEKESLV